MLTVCWRRSSATLRCQPSCASTLSLSSPLRTRVCMRPAAGASTAALCCGAPPRGPRRSRHAAVPMATMVCPQCLRRTQVFMGLFRCPRRRLGGEKSQRPRIITSAALSCRHRRPLRPLGMRGLATGRAPLTMRRSRREGPPNAANMRTYRLRGFPQRLLICSGRCGPVAASTPPTPSWRCCVSARW